MAEVSRDIRDTARALAVDRATAEVVQALDRAGVPNVLLKGRATARALYTDGTARPYIDADLLVPAALVERAEQTLAALGFTGPSRRAFHGRWTPSGVEHRRASDQSAVDLHVTVHGARVDAGTVWEVLDPETEVTTLFGVPVRVPRDGVLAYLLAAHAAHHGARSDKPLRDLERAVERMSEETWREAAAVAERLGGQAALAEGLRLVPAGRAVAERLALPATAAVETILEAGSPPASALGWQRVLAERGLAARAHALARELLPSRAYMSTLAPLAGRGRVALAAAYVRRLVRLSVELPAAVRALRAARREARARQLP